MASVPTIKLAVAAAGRLVLAARAARVARAAARTRKAVLAAAALATQGAPEVPETAQQHPPQAPREALLATALPAVREALLATPELLARTALAAAAEGSTRMERTAAPVSIVHGLLRGFTVPAVAVEATALRLMSSEGRVAYTAVAEQAAASSLTLLTNTEAPARRGSS